MKRAFRLGEIAQKVAREPHVALLKEAPPRKGFFEREQLEALLPHLPAPVRAVVEVAYITGWRIRSEILTRQWEHVDLRGGWLRLDPGETKNDESRSFPCTGSSTARASPSATFAGLGSQPATRRVSRAASCPTKGRFSR